MLEDILNNISIITYGRQKKKKEWSIAEKIGVNRFYYIHSGQATFYMHSREITFEPGNIYFCPRNIEFSVAADDELGIDHTFFDFYLNTCSAPDIIGMPKDENPLIAAATDSLIYIADKHPMFPVLKRNDFYDSVKTYLANIVFYLMREDKGISFFSDSRILAALTFIQNNIFNDISVNDVANHVNLDTNYFIKLFKKTVQTSPYQYMKNYRLNFAITLIKKGATVSEAAEFIGYNSLAAFTHTIKSYTGLLPSEIKNMSINDK